MTPLDFERFGMSVARINRHKTVSWCRGMAAQWRLQVSMFYRDYWRIWRPYEGTKKRRSFVWLHSLDEASLHDRPLRAWIYSKLWLASYFLPHSKSKMYYMSIYVHMFLFFHGKNIYLWESLVSSEADSRRSTWVGCSKTCGGVDGWRVPAELSNGRWNSFKMRNRSKEF